MKPFIKWPGGKEKEVKIISKCLPVNIDKYFEPFVGGGAVYFSLDKDEYLNIEKYINDISVELTTLYRLIKEENKCFFDSLKNIQKNWNILEEVIRKHSYEFINYYYRYLNDELEFDDMKNELKIFIDVNEKDFNGVMKDKEFNPCIDLFKKTINEYVCRRFKRLKVLSKDSNLTEEDFLNSVETALKGSFYNHYRYIYNNKDKDAKIKIKEEFASAIYYFIRENCYSSMFRYNSNGDFNIPYGGMAYNKKRITNKINKSLCNYMKNTTIENMDFMDFLKKYKPKENDFVFVDPPYDSDFSKYANSEFLKKDHERLCDTLSKMSANVMVVIKKTDYIFELYKKHNFNIYEFNKKYLVNCKNRNKRDVIHLIITNYEIPDEESNGNITRVY